MKKYPQGPRYWFNMFAVTVLIIFLSFAGIVASFSYKQTQEYLHPVRLRASGDFLNENNIPYKDIELTTQDGLKLAAWYTPPQNGRLILVAHGHGNVRLEDMYVLFASHGYGVLAWDFRAHGKAKETLVPWAIMKLKM